MLKSKYFYNSRSYTITVVSDDITQGTVSGGGNFKRGSTTVITASALSGYEFVRWNDGDTNYTRVISVIGDATYTAYFLVERLEVVLNTNNNSQDAYVIYNGTTYQAGTIFSMLPNETCTLYILPKYGTWNNIQSSKRLPFLGFDADIGTIGSMLKLSNEYITAVYTAPSTTTTQYCGNIFSRYGSVSVTPVNVLVGFPQVKSSTTNPFSDNSAHFTYQNVSPGTIKGSGYYLDSSSIISDSTNIISANYLWQHSRRLYDWTVKSDGTWSGDYTPSPLPFPMSNVLTGVWCNSAITVSITIPEDSLYEFVKWKIDRMDCYSGTGSGIYPLYQDSLNNWGNDYFEEYYHTTFNLTTCTIPFPGCYVQITPILKLKTP